MRIVRTFFVLLFLLALANFAPAYGQSAPVIAPAIEAPSGPSAEVLEKDFNFGEMYEGKDYVHLFPIKNTGNAPLEIRKVVPG